MQNMQNSTEQKTIRSSDVLTVQDVCKLWKVTTSYVINLFDAGVLEGFSLGSDKRRVIRIFATSVFDVMEQRKRVNFDGKKQTTH